MKLIAIMMLLAMVHGQNTPRDNLRDRMTSREDARAAIRERRGPGEALDTTPFTDEEGVVLGDEFPGLREIVDSVLEERTGDDSLRSNEPFEKDDLLPGLRSMIRTIILEDIQPEPRETPRGGTGGVVRGRTQQDDSSPRGDSSRERIQENQDAFEFPGLRALLRELILENMEESPRAERVRNNRNP